MKNLFYFLMIPLCMGMVVACTPDDEKETGLMIPDVSGNADVDVVGRWQQSEATLGGESAYLVLHLNPGGTGHVVFRTKTVNNPVVSYDAINYEVRGNLLTIIGSSIAGVYMVENSTISLTLTNTENSLQARFSKSVTESSIHKYVWKRKTTDSSIRNYFLWDFDTTGNGVMTWVGEKSSDKTEYPFSYDLDYEKGTLTVNFTDGSSSHYFYVVHVGGNLLLFLRDRSSNEVKCFVFIPSRIK